MALFAEIAFPTAIRQTFTYEVPTQFRNKIETGVRVWVPFRSHFAIGVVVDLHDTKPEFKTKEIKQVLDEEPILSDELLGLTEWIHRFYFCSWGEVIQAALPVGLNFVSKKRLRVSNSSELILRTGNEKEIINDIQTDESLTLDSAKKRYKDTSLNKVFKKLLHSGMLEVWEEPDIKVSAKTERAWDWAEGKNSKLANKFLDSQDKNFKWMEALEIFASK